MAYEFLAGVDPTGDLGKELSENIKNGSIILWDSNDIDTRKKMQELYGKKFNIDTPLCYSQYGEDDNLISQVLNLPLQFTIDDVFALIHEFFHFHGNYHNLQRGKSNLLEETFSIYFENLVLEFLKGKGYSEEDLPVNFRVVDAICNFTDISPSIIYFSQYMKAGKVDLDYLYGIIRMVEDGYIEVYDPLGMSEEQRKIELEKVGIYENIEDSANNLICNINNILLRNDESIYRGSPYLFGTILSKFAMENNVPVSLMLQFCNDLNRIEDPCELMERIGVDLAHYGFRRKISVKEGEISDVWMTGIRMK